MTDTKRRRYTPYGLLVWAIAGAVLDSLVHTGGWLTLAGFIAGASWDLVRFLVPREPREWRGWGDSGGDGGSGGSFAGHGGHGDGGSDGGGGDGGGGGGGD
jgi:hypothetical protein